MNRLINVLSDWADELIDDLNEATIPTLANQVIKKTKSTVKCPRDVNNHQYLDKPMRWRQGDYYCLQ